MNIPTTHPDGVLLRHMAGRDAVRQQDAAYHHVCDDLEENDSRLKEKEKEIAA